MMNRRKTCSAAVIVAVALLAQAAGGVAAAHPACPGDGDCCEPNMTPGCDDADCCNLICDIDPWCCDNRWDSICAGAAEDFCPACPSDPCQSEGDCLPDEVCVEGNCVDAGCPLDCPPGALTEGEACGSDANGGCSSSAPIFTPAACGDTFCGTSWAAFHQRDTDWYLVDHPGGLISATLTSEFPGTCFIVAGVGPGGEPCDPYVVGDVGCSENRQSDAVASAALPPGPVAVVVVLVWCSGSGIPDGYPCGGANDYVLSIACGPCVGDCEATPDQSVGMADFLALLAQWGQVGAQCDFDGGGVGVTDFLELLANWGTCP